MPFREDFTVKDLIKRLTVGLNSFPRLIVPKSYLNLIQHGESKVLPRSTRLAELSPGEDGIVHLMLVVSPAIKDIHIKFEQYSYMGTISWQFSGIEFDEKTFEEVLPHLFQLIDFHGVPQDFELSDGACEFCPFNDNIKTKSLDEPIKTYYQILPIKDGFREVRFACDFGFHEVCARVAANKLGETGEDGI